MTTTITAQFNTIPAEVQNVSSFTPNGSYNLGDTISIQVVFDKPVTVSGTSPTLLLETGATDRTALYTGGSGTTTLMFNYIVNAGDSSADLDYVSSSALTGTITNGGVAADTALPAVGGPGSLGFNKDLIIDTAAPTVQSVTSPTPDGTYGPNSTITIHVNFGESVSVSGGSPTLSLNSGGTAIYASGSGTSTLVFNYTTAAGHTAADLNYASTNSLVLSGAAIRDAAGNAAILILPATGSASSLGGSRNFVITP
jgi:hypothetical protein